MNGLLQNLKVCAITGPSIEEKKRLLRESQSTDAPLTPSLKNASVKRTNCSLETCAARHKRQSTSALCLSPALHHPSLSGPSPPVFKSGATGCHWENPLSTVGWWLHALLHHTFVPSSSLSHDKVGDELSHPSALWVPVCLCRGNKVSTLLLQNGVSQSKWWEIGQQCVVEGQKKAHSAPVASLDALLVWLIIWGENPHSSRVFSTWDPSHKTQNSPESFKTQWEVNLYIYVLSKRIRLFKSFHFGTAVGTLCSLCSLQMTKLLVVLIIVNLDNISHTLF